MAVINVLSPLVADMIAAGEVVERPGSVVKELLENAVDAGAKNVTVELRGGGTTYIRVTDDGCGMTPDDAGNCFLRHATSKLRDADGLSAIGTLGFRGEALAAISAVSRIELRTRPRGAASGTRVLVSGGEIRGMGECGCPEGTSFTVSDLFFNTPARLKFMKSDRAESSYCVSLAMKVALGHPELSVRCIHDGREDFLTPGDGRIQSAVYSLFGRDTAKDMLPCEGGGGDIDVTGYVSAPRIGRGNRAMQFFFVNGRAIKSATLQAALEQAYKNTLLTGRYPACALYIRLSPALVDVNVHPTKNEVKFSRESAVFEAVYHTVLSALEAERSPAPAVRTPAAEKHVNSAIFHKSAPSGTERTGWVQPQTVRPVSVPPLFRTPPLPQTEVVMHSSAPVYRAEPARPAAPAARQPAAFETAPPAPAEKPKPVPPQGERPWCVLGEVMNTYIVVDLGDTMLLIDKHAAHERINFNRLKEQQGAVMAQNLLTPIPWHAPAEERELVGEYAAILEKLGFVLEEYGDEDMVIRAVPAEMDAGDAVSALEEICEQLARGGRDLAADRILQTIACKAAIKAGWTTDLAELEALAARVISGEIRYCPHGRPVAVAVTRAELDKKFKRIV